jgi:hypothetical protein
MRAPHAEDHMRLVSLPPTSPTASDTDNRDEASPSHHAPHAEHGRPISQAVPALPLWGARSGVRPVLRRLLPLLSILLRRSTVPAEPPWHMCRRLRIRVPRYELLHIHRWRPHCALLRCAAAASLAERLYCPTPLPLCSPYVRLQVDTEGASVSFPNLVNVEGDIRVRLLGAIQPLCCMHTQPQIAHMECGTP